MSILATRVAGYRPPGDWYQCRRCGIVRETSHSRATRYCRDCRDVDPQLCRPAAPDQTATP